MTSKTGGPAAPSKRNRKKKIASIALLIGTFGLLLGAVAGALFAGSGTQTAGTTAVPTSTPVSTKPAADLTYPPPGETITGETPCPNADGSSPRTTQFEESPPMCLFPDTPYWATLKTGLGDIVIRLDTENAPDLANNFAVLSLYHYYDGVPWSRIVAPIFIASGDASGPEGKAPGYAFESPNPDAGALAPLQVAMFAQFPTGPFASAFLIATSAQSGALIPQGFPPFGEVQAGAEAIAALEQLGNGSGEPTDQVNIESVEITSIQPPAVAETAPTLE